MKSKTGLIAGSFDPPTLGHIEVIKRTAGFCDLLIVGIAANSKKPNSTFTFLEREALILESCEHLPNIRVVEIPGLVVEYAKHHAVDFLVRGLRSAADFEMEMQMAISNRKLCGIETLFLMADPAFAHISSTLIHEIALGGYRLHGFVHHAVEDAIYTRITLKS
jgi:pantetheine-phosphate adenylyltransferase